jgi:hypothetical protein
MATPKTLVQTKSGVIIEVPEDLVESGIRRGSYQRLDPEFEKQYKSATSQPIRAGLESALNTATLGLSNQIQKQTGLATPEEMAMRQFANPAASALGTGVGIAAPIAASLLTGGTAAPAAVGALEGAEVAATAAPSLLKSAATAVGEYAPINLVSKGGAALSEAIAPAIGKGVGSVVSSPLAQKVLTKGLTGAIQGGAEGAVFGLGNAISEDALGDPEALGEHLLSHIGEGALFGSTITGALSGATPIAGAALKKLGESDIVQAIQKHNPIKKVFSVLTGTSEEAIDNYLANSERIKANPQLSDVYDHIYTHIDDTFNKVTDTKASLDKFKSQLDNIEEMAKTRLGATKENLAQVTKEAKEIATQVKTDFIENVKIGAREKGVEIANYLDDLHQSIVKQSADSFGILENSDKWIEIEPFYKNLENSASKLEDQGTTLAKKQAEALRAQAQSIRETYGSGKVQAANFKNIIKGLDNLTNWENKGAADFDPQLNRYFKNARYFIDDMVKKEVPEYAAAMQPLSEQVRLLKSLSKYGTPQGAEKAILSLKNPVNYKYEIDAIKKLEEVSGLKFTDDIEKWANQAKLSETLEKLPEVQAHMKAKQALEAMSSPRIKAMIENELSQSPAFKKAMIAEAEYAQALAAKTDLGGVTRGNVQGKIQRAVNGDKEIRRILSELPSFEGKEIRQILEDERTSQMLSGGFGKGSSNTNRWGAIGAAGGSMLGLGPIGAGVGSVIGGMVDASGRSVARTILDAYLGASKLGTLGKIIPALNESSKKIISGSKSIFTHGVTTGVIQSGMSLKEFEKIQKKIDMEMIKEHDGQEVTSISEEAPMISANYLAKKMQMVTFLHDKLPKPVNQKILSPEYQPSTAEIAKFNRYFQAVKNPTQVLKDIKKQGASNEQIETLAAIYPKMYEEMQHAIIDDLTTHIAKGKKVNYQVSLNLSKFMKTDLVNSLSKKYVQAMQIPTNTADDSSQAIARPAAFNNLNFSNRITTSTQNAELNGV